MTKKDIRIAIVDDSKAALRALESFLKEFGYLHIEKFNSSNDFLQFCMQTPVDIAFIDYAMPGTDGFGLLSKLKKVHPEIITVMLTGIVDIKIKQRAIELGVNEFMFKDIDYPEFKAKMDILTNLKILQYNQANINKELSTLLRYKDAQEILAVKKQLKIINDEVSHRYYGNIEIGSYFHPKDTLSGDSYSTIKISDSRFLFIIADGMGKGLSASFSSVLTVAFINHALKKSLSFNDFNFRRLTKDTFDYVKTILLNGETLSLILLDYDVGENVCRYANFGMPPVYTTHVYKKLKPNNLPILKNSKNFKIDTLPIDFESLLIASDGLFESDMDRDGKPYLVRFKEIIQHTKFLYNIINDFKHHVKKADDDVTIIMLSKDTDTYTPILKDHFLIQKENITHFVDNLEEKLIPLSLKPKLANKIVFIFNEMLLNVYEHAHLKLSDDKHRIIKNNQKIDYNDTKQNVAIMLSQSSTHLKISIDDHGPGFDVGEIMKRKFFDKYHGRGLQLVLKLSEGFFYSDKGNIVNIYLKRSP